MRSRILPTMFLAITILLGSCGAPADPLDVNTVYPKTTAPSIPTEEPTPTQLPAITIESYYPNDSASIEELVILRGEDNLFDPAAEVSGGVGELSFAWDFDGDLETIESIEMDPDPMLLEPGEIFPVLTVTDEAGQVLTVELPKVVKIGDPVQPNWQYGVMAHVNILRGYYGDEEEVIRALDMISDAGIEAFRVDFEWSMIECLDNVIKENERDYCSWEYYDMMVDHAHERDLEVIGLIGFSPKWASISPDDSQYWIYPPEDPAKFAEFVFEAVQRYEGKVNTWEIWSEPNISLTFKGTNPQDYFPLLQGAFLSAKYADPEVIVLIGGLANGPSITGIPGKSPEDFLAELLDLGAADYSDGSALHPYTDPNLGANVLIQRISSVRDVMDKHGAENQLLWITEIGHPIFHAWSESLVVNWLRTSFETIQEMDGIGPILWYQFKDKSQDPADHERHRGLVYEDFEPKLTYWAFKEYIEQHH